MGHSNTSYLSNMSIFHFQWLEKEYPIRLDKNAAYMCFWIGFFGPTISTASPWRRMSPQSVENDLGSMYISFSCNEKLRNYDEWWMTQPESQVVITFRKTHASKSTHYNSLIWKLLRNHPSPFKTNNHHHPKSSQLFDHPATWTSKCEKPKLWIKSSADPRKTRLDPRVGEAQPSEAVAKGRNGQLGWSTTMTGKKWKGDFWLMTSWTQVLHRKILGPSQLPAGFGAWLETVLKTSQKCCISKAILMKIYHGIPCCSSKIASMLQTRSVAKLFNWF